MRQPAYRDLVAELVLDVAAANGIALARPAAGDLADSLIEAAHVGRLSAGQEIGPAVLVPLSQAIAMDWQGTNNSPVPFNGAAARYGLASLEFINIALESGLSGRLKHFITTNDRRQGILFKATERNIDQRESFVYRVAIEGAGRVVHLAPRVGPDDLAQAQRSLRLATSLRDVVKPDRYDFLSDEIDILAGVLQSLSRRGQLDRRS